ncbi:hypothetical protein [Alicyclobacillus dauci]|uniref:DUF4179 domain-containing protein n=1 Tax=Alicyclobacillus dauci TaxID=1475485 RepID=A0ABY6Z4H8_9BACL|nr:hypothetical protein [Alicyclobacillus dauci]WAH37793.1 hypothetical protein NZD86_04620 [Alicyclobacillus dauci]
MKEPPDHAIGAESTNFVNGLAGRGMNVHFEDDLRDKVRELPIPVPSESEKYALIDLAAQQFRPRRPYRQRRLVWMLGSLGAALIFVALGFCGYDSDMNFERSTSQNQRLPDANSTPSDYQIHFSPVAANPNISQGTHTWNLDVSMGQWGGQRVEVIATSTDPSVTVAFTGWTGANVRLAANMPEPQNTINAYLQSHGLSGTDLPALVSKPTEDDQHAQAVINSSATVNPADLRLVIMDVKQVGDGQSERKYEVVWAKIVRPDRDTTVAKAISHSIPAGAKNVVVGWQQQQASVAFAAVKYEQNGEKHLATMILQLDALGDWVVADVLASPGLTPQSLGARSLYPMDWGGSIDGESGAFNVYTGIVKDAHTVSVRVTYSDGQEVTVPVVNGVFGTVRHFPGNGNNVPGISMTQALDKTGRVVDEG